MTAEGGETLERVSLGERTKAYALRIIRIWIEV